MYPDPGAAAEVIVGLLSRLPRSRLARDTGITYLSTGLTLILNLATGVVIARSFGPDGRGALAAILTLAQVAGTVFALGAMPAVAYHVARHPKDGGRLLSTWIVMLVPCAALGIVIAELLVPVLFAAQSDHTKALARLYVLTLIVTLLVQPLHGLITGERLVGLWSALRVAQPLLGLVFVLLLLAVGEFSVETALLATLAAAVLSAGLAAAPAIRRHGWGPPSARLGRASLSYGIRGLGATVTQAVNMRLDLLIMPAFLGAGAVGLYSVATNVSWLIVAVSSPLWWLVMPEAARRGAQGTGAVLRLFRLTLALSLALATLIAATAAIVIPAVYGEPFAPAVTALYLLLPGCVLLPAGGIITSGIYAAGRPFASGVPHLVGSVITVAGLVLFLERGGIEAAAVVTSTAYAAVALVSLLVYRRIARFQWRALLPGG